MTTEIKIDMANMPPLPPEAFDPIKDAMIEALTKGGAEWRERALVAEAQTVDAAARIEALERELAEANARVAVLREGLAHAATDLSAHLESHHDSEDETKEAGDLRHLLHHIEGTLVGSENLAAHRARTEGKANG